MKMQDLHLGFIGFGHMAQVIFKAIDLARLVPRSQILFSRRDPGKIKASEQQFHITSTSLSTLVERSHILFLCIRPTQLMSVLEPLAAMNLEGKKVITVVAGVKIEAYQKILGTHIPFLRAMPNIASEVGEGVTSFSFSSSADPDFKSAAHLLFSSMGHVLEIEEARMDIATALGGSGPGFVFRLIEAAAREGERHGLTYEIALQMVAQSFAGAARLILKGKMPQDLLHAIATPNGITEAGLNKLAQLGVDRNFCEAIAAAMHRSQELSR